MLKNSFLIFFVCIVSICSYGQDENSANHKNYISKIPVIDMHFHSDWWGAPEIEETLSGFRSYKDRKTFASEVSNTLINTTL